MAQKVVQIGAQGIQVEAPLEGAGPEDLNRELEEEEEKKKIENFGKLPIFFRKEPKMANLFVLGAGSFS